MMVRVKKQALTPMQLMQPLMWMLVVFYLGYHMLHGERGVYALLRDKREVALLEKELATTKMEREKMERRVTNLRSGSLDRDLLDEQMRRMMGVMKKGEVVVLSGHKS
jgi:cell division protein FtsB